MAVLAVLTHYENESVLVLERIALSKEGRDLFALVGEWSSKLRGMSRDGMFDLGEKDHVAHWRCIQMCSGSQIWSRWRREQNRQIKLADNLSDTQLTTDPLRSSSLYSKTTNLTCLLVASSSSG